MIKVAIFFDFPPETTGGIKTYCDNIKKLFEGNPQISITIFDSLPYKKIGLVKLYNMSAIKQALSSNDFDIIHINGFISTIPYFITKGMKLLHINKPLIYTPHAHPFYTLNHPNINKVFFHFFVKPILKKSTIIISLNKEDSNFFSKYNKNIKTIPHWIFSNINVQKKSTNLPPILLFVGRNDANKNLSQLYSLPKGKYKIICVTNKKPERDDFIFKTGISDVQLNNLYQLANLTIIPSRYEAFSYTAMESLWNGTPILVSNRVRIVDFLENVSGVTIYDYNDKDDFLQKVDKAMEQIVEKETIDKIFSKESALIAYSELYTSVYIHDKEI